MSFTRQLWEAAQFSWILWFRALKRSERERALASGSVWPWRNMESLSLWKACPQGQHREEVPSATEAGAFCSLWVITGKGSTHIISPLLAFQPENWSPYMQKVKGTGVENLQLLPQHLMLLLILRKNLDVFSKTAYSVQVLWYMGRL